jgi:putative transposase
VVQAYVEGVSTRRVDDLVIAMGGTGISKSEVSRICAQLDSEVALWRTRPLDHIAFPYLLLDATYCKVRLAGRVVFSGRRDRDRRKCRREKGSAGLRDR